MPSKRKSRSTSPSDNKPKKQKNVIDKPKKKQNVDDKPKKKKKVDDKPKKQKNVEEAVIDDVEDMIAYVDEEFADVDEEIADVAEFVRKVAVPAKDEGEDGEDSVFVGEPIAEEEARKRWPNRYLYKKTLSKGGIQKIMKSNDDDQQEPPLLALRHFSQANVDGQIYNLLDDAYVMADGEDSYICKIVELFESVAGSLHFNAQWFYRAKDTVIGDRGTHIDDKCIFFSEVKDDNPLDCLLKKLHIVKLSPKADLEYKKNIRDTCDFYYEMMYLLPYNSFVSVSDDDPTQTNLSASTDSDSAVTSEAASPDEKADLVLMDIYAGCGAMSTGLCLGASRGGVKLTTKWAIDINKHACDSLRLNHPETQVRNEPAEYFLSLLREWHRLCSSYSLIVDTSKDQCVGLTTAEDSVVEEDNEDEEEEDEGDQTEVYEVEEILDICYGDPRGVKEIGLHFKIRWKGYGPQYDTWEPLDCVSGCPEKLKNFVVQGFNSKLLPLPGDVDVICGGPPCQGISGFNRFRDAVNPLRDEKNKQMKVYMDFVSFLKPKYLLMENVVDILKFAGGFLAKYGLDRLVGMGYQARMGMMAAGSYGLPQFRMRFFLWGALATEKLPQYALPTHNVVNRGVVPVNFESNVVAYEKGHNNVLKTELFLQDALSDLPPVENNEHRDEMPYNDEPRTDFQRFIRLKKEVMLGSTGAVGQNEVLYDHRPLNLNDDDYQRVCQIPKRKGANFRDLPGVLVGPDNVVYFDPEVERVYLASGKPLVPEYAMTFVGGKSTKPFGRLSWDVTVPTVITRAEPHNHCIIHPTQDRVLTIRENARLQGFPDYYKLVGPIKERYTQVGNAVAMPVARALGYCLALSYKGETDDNQPLVKLPSNFSIFEGSMSPAQSS